MNALSDSQTCIQARIVSDAPLIAAVLRLRYVHRQVAIDNMGPGLVVISVIGYNIPQGPQKYSLVVQVCPFSCTV